MTANLYQFRNGIITFLYDQPGRHGIFFSAIYFSGNRYHSALIKVKDLEFGFLPTKKHSPADEFSLENVGLVPKVTSNVDRGKKERSAVLFHIPVKFLIEGNMRTM